MRAEKLKKMKDRSESIRTSQQLINESMPLIGDISVIDSI